MYRTFSPSVTRMGLLPGKQKVILGALLLINMCAHAQATIQLLGSAGSGGPVGQGPATTSQIVTFFKDPSTPFTPTLTATYSLSNQQFASIEGNPGTPGTVFGGDRSTLNSPVTSRDLYPLMNGISGSANANYTSCNSCTAGTGVSTGTNHSITLFNSTDALISSSGVQNFALTARVQYADLTITFSTPVDNPIIQLTGLGGDYFYNTTDCTPTTGVRNYVIGFSTELDLITPELTLSKKSGSTFFDVSGSTVFNTAPDFSAPTTPAPEFGITRAAASGSVAVLGTGITTVTFRIYLKGDGGKITDGNGNIAAATCGNFIRWAPQNGFVPNGTSAPLTGIAGDVILVGISLEDPTVLPVTLTNFDVVKENMQANLNWSTTEETNSNRFEIQRSADSKIWSAIGVKPAANESKMLLTYTFTDQSPLSGINYYRLKMIDNDETFSYSRIRSVEFEGKQAGIYPNPVSDFLLLKGVDPKKIEQVIIQATNGNTVYATKSIDPQGINVRMLPAGMYIVTVKENNGDCNSHKIIVSR